MSDRLREALEWYEELRTADRLDWLSTLYEQVNPLAAAARRFLALTETGPDYRRAAIEWMGEEPPAEFKGNWDDVIDAAIEQTVKPVVDAALADYLTEEDR